VRFLVSSTIVSIKGTPVLSKLPDHAIKLIFDHQAREHRLLQDPYDFKTDLKSAPTHVSKSLLRITSSG
jgi:hypothetical protein